MKIATGKALSSITNKDVSWAKFCQKLETPFVDDVTYAEYLALPKNDQDRRKNQGFYVGAYYEGGNRKRDNIIARTVVTIDADSITPTQVQALRDGSAEICKYQFVAHSTRKHTPEKPRIRLNVLLDEDVKPDDYGPVARVLAAGVGEGAVDDVSFRPNQLMYWPSVCSDSEFFYFRNEGETAPSRKLFTRAQELGLDKKERSEVPDDLKEPLDLSTDEIKATCALLDKDKWINDYSGWIDLGMSLHHQFRGSDEGLDLWFELSKEYPNASYEEHEFKWDSFNLKKGGITLASILHEVRPQRLAAKFDDVVVEDDDEFFGVEKEPSDDEVEALVAGLEGNSGETDIDFDMQAVGVQDWSKIPRRQFLYGKSYIEGFVSAVVSPGGLGKSSLVMTESVSMAMNLALLRSKTLGRRLNVLYSNLEDPKDELNRRYAGILKHHEVDDAELSKHLFFTGRDTELSVAFETKTGIKFNRKTIRKILDNLRAINANVWIVDPFVSLHGLSENDNSKIDKVLKFLGRLAGLLGIAICVVHHVRKPGSQQTETTANDARGAGAFLAAVRSARVLNRMSKDDAKKIGITNHWAYFRVDDGKSNMAPPSSAADWYKLASSELGNDSEFGAGDGDSIGVVETWEPPSPTSGMSSTQTKAFLDMIAAGDWKANVRAGDDWAGVVLAKVLDLDPVEDRSRLSAILDDMLTQGVLKTEERFDKNKNKRPFVAVGDAKLAFFDDEDDIF